jgi:hypothetical protein
MGTAAVLSLLTGWSATAPAVVAAALVVLWNTAIYFDSSALTAGTVQPEPERVGRAAVVEGPPGGHAGPGIT